MDNTETNKRARTEAEEEAEVVKLAPERLSWLSAVKSDPDRVTYKQLLRVSEQKWNDDKIWFMEAAQDYFTKKYLAELSEDEKKKYDTAPGLIQEFDELRVLGRFKRAIAWKMWNLTTQELVEWEAAAETEDKAAAETEDKAAAETEAEAEDKAAAETEAENKTE